MLIYHSKWYSTHTINVDIAWKNSLTVVFDKKLSIGIHVNSNILNPYM